VLTSALRDLLKHTNSCALKIQDPAGRIHVFLKLPLQAVSSLKSPVPLRHFLFMAPMPTAPVLGWFFETHVHSCEPVRAIIYFNVAFKTHMDDLKQLKHQDLVETHFIQEERLEVIAVQQIQTPLNLAKLLEAALIHATEIPKGQYDWHSARSEFQNLYPHKEISNWH
jgi:hypothetical protein